MRNLFHNKRLRQGFLLVVMLGFLFKLTTSSRNSEETRMLDEFWSRYSVHAVPIPDDMEFAGEQVPLEDLEVRERAVGQYLFPILNRPQHEKVGSVVSSIRTHPETIWGSRRL